MKTLEYHTVDKSTWGDGPWMSEPDKVQYPDPETGMPCLIVRNRWGALCGYVGVPEGHKYHGVGGYEHDLSVHGGITFTGACSPGEDEANGICHLPGEGDPDNVWWLGFDCGHHMDFCPALQNDFSKELRDVLGRDSEYRDISYVKSQIAHLATQLKKA